MALTLPLWPDGQVPFSVGAEPVDCPELAIWRPPVGGDGPVPVMVICPGGGYGMHAPHEAEPVARWANSLGMIGAILTYRLAPRYRHPAMLADILRAIQSVRALADEIGADPNRVGVLGFSAGGHLASCAATLWGEGVADSSDPVNRMSSRPDVAVLIYPVISLDGSAAHLGSRNNLLGEIADPALVKSLSTHTRVTEKTPPTFLVHGCDDIPVPARNALLFASACAEAGVTVGVNIVANGPHGFGLGDPRYPETLRWPAACADFLRSIDFLPSAEPNRER